MIQVFRWLSFGLMLAAGAGMVPRAAAAAGADDYFIRVYRLIQEADQLKQAGQSDRALAKYLEAEQGLQNLRKAFPGWNVRVIDFRLAYVAERIGPLRAAGGAGAAPGVAAASSRSEPATGAPAVSSEVERELRELREQVQRLEADRTALNARLQEALTAQPAAVDPRQLEQAQAAIRALEKEKDLLRAALEQRDRSVADRSALNAEYAAARDALRAAEAKLEQQNRTIEELRGRPAAARDPIELARAREQIELLASENEILRARAKALGTPAAAAELDKLKRELAEARSELSAQKAEYEKLLEQNRESARRLELADAALRAAQTQDKKLREDLDEVRAKLAAVTTDTNRLGMFGRMRLNRLQREQERLERDLDLARESARTNAAAVTQLQQEKAQLEKQLRSAGAPEERGAEPARIRQLERERDDLKRQLREASRQNAARSRSKQTPSAAAAPDQSAAVDEIAALRARVEVLEAQKAPYTPEELALFRRPEAGVPPPSPPQDANRPAEPPRARARKSLPAAASLLAMEAQRDFAAKRFGDAEAKYREILKMDEENVGTLSNLAAILAEQNRVEEAERLLTRALDQESRNAFSLLLMGRVRFQQERYDEALNYLGLAAQEDPQSAETQNYLGVVLSQKGQRSAAEAALRKAVSLSPSYGGAHHNLAVIYATQNPPFIELARWHYQKAISAGHGRNDLLESKLGSAAEITAAAK